MKCQLWVVAYTIPGAFYHPDIRPHYHTSPPAGDATHQFHRTVPYSAHAAGSTQ
jgi:hypothetical protein